MKVPDGERIGITQSVPSCNGDRPLAEAIDVSCASGQRRSGRHVLEVTAGCEIGKVTDRASSAFLNPKLMEARRRDATKVVRMGKAIEPKIRVVDQGFRASANESIPLESSIATSDALTENGLDGLDEDKSVSGNPQVPMAPE